MAQLMCFPDSMRRGWNSSLKWPPCRRRRKKRRRRMRKAAAGLQPASLSACIWASTSSAFRTPVLNFFTEVRETYSELLVEKDDRKGVTEHFQEYEPEYTVKGVHVLFRSRRRKNLLQSRCGRRRDSGTIFTTTRNLRILRWIRKNW